MAVRMVGFCLQGPFAKYLTFGEIVGARPWVEPQSGQVDPQRTGALQPEREGDPEADLVGVLPRGQVSPPSLRPVVEARW